MSRFDNGYQPRSYRRLFNNRDYCFFNICVGESDLSIGIDIGPVPALQHDTSLSWDERIEAITACALRAVRRLRNHLDEYILAHPIFLESMTPVSALPDAPEIVRRMCIAASKTGVGPMAAVAGAVAEMTGRAVLEYDSSIRGIVVENGGDLFVKLSKPISIGIFAGSSPLSGKIAISVSPEDTPAGICASSGTHGHSMSFGHADAAVVTASDAFLADAAATALGNAVTGKDKLSAAVESIMKIDGVNGAIAIIGDSMSALGRIVLQPAQNG